MSWPRLKITMRASLLMNNFLRERNKNERERERERKDPCSIAGVIRYYNMLSKIKTCYMEWYKSNIYLTSRMYAPRGCSI